MDNIINSIKEHWDTILITVLAIAIFYSVFRSKMKKEKYRNK
ncbi:hypothetical protein SAMN05421738_101215 [Algoriella xinjiangensis]|uniref:Uncharacterized protein n=1 Tax=Algoriella xinjiangensis TaxID=684065 RepID=A0A1I4SHP6_9FLAO|nr:MULTISPECIES: hypothetical protein [Algoriella]SFM64006.1 hypothetical protein SAMN05421738_101215 [Algoriella xinjiangensis]VDH16068.1 Uncharacterised protein [Algoriella xinjiangensis]